MTKYHSEELVLEFLDGKLEPIRITESFTNLNRHMIKTIWLQRGLYKYTTSNRNKLFNLIDMSYKYKVIPKNLNNYDVPIVKRVLKCKILGM